MGLGESWPTFWIDLTANLPFIFLNLLFRFDGKSHPRWRAGLNVKDTYSFDPPNPTETIDSHWWTRIAFWVWTVEVVLSMGVAIGHMVVRHHPKFYATPCNRLAIVAHIIGGVTAILGSYIGFLLQSKILLLVAVFSGVFLHFPSAMWQARNVHGARETMQPGYMFVNFTLLFKEMDVLIYGAAESTVIEMGVALGTFSLVRTYYWLYRKAGTSPHFIYERSCISAVVTNMPFTLGTFSGVPMAYGTIILWNVLMGIFLPSMRELMRVNHSYQSVLPDSRRFRDELESCLLTQPNRQEAVARAVFNCLAGGKDYATLKEVADMTEHWGIPSSMEVAKEIFRLADSDNNERVEFEEFRRHMWFVWEHVDHVGELAGDDALAVTRVTEVVEAVRQQSPRGEDPEEGRQQSPREEVLQSPREEDPLLHL